MLLLLVACDNTTPHNNTLSTQESEFLYETMVTPTANEVRATIPVTEAVESTQTSVETAPRFDVEEWFSVPDMPKPFESSSLTLGASYVKRTNFNAPCVLKFCSEIDLIYASIFDVFEAFGTEIAVDDFNEEFMGFRYSENAIELMDYPNIYHVIMRYNISNEAVAEALNKHNKRYEEETNAERAGVLTREQVLQRYIFSEEEIEALLSRNEDEIARR